MCAFQVEGKFRRFFPCELWNIYIYVKKLSMERGPKILRKKYLRVPPVPHVDWC